MSNSDNKVEESEDILCEILTEDLEDLDGTTASASSEGNANKGRKRPLPNDDDGVRDGKIGKWTKAKDNDFTASADSNQANVTATKDEPRDDNKNSSMEYENTKEDKGKKCDERSSNDEKGGSNGNDLSSSEDEEDPKVSNLSISSASFGSQSDLDLETDKAKNKTEHGGGEAKLSNNGSSGDKHQKKKDYLGGLNYILKDARFYLMKSGNNENVELSKSRGVWSTPPANETKINQSLKETRNVFLIFSVKESGKFNGFARVISTSSRSAQPVNWILPPGLTQKALGGIFPIDWISKNDVLFTKTQHLFNPWNDGKPVKIGRDGQEIESNVASELCRLFPIDYTTDMNLIVKRSRESGEKLGVSGQSGGGSSNFNSFRGRSSRSNYGGSHSSHHSLPSGMRKNDPSSSSSASRPRYHPYSPSSRRLPGSDHGRTFGSHGRRNSGSTPDPYSSSSARKSSEKRMKSPKGYYETYNVSGSSRGLGGSSSSRYYQTSSGPRIHDPLRSYSSRKAPAAYDYVVRDFRPPPPVAPLPYPPPPPFDNLPPPPRYYDGPPLPELPPTTSSRESRSHRSEREYRLGEYEYHRRREHNR